MLPHALAQAMTAAELANTCEAASVYQQCLEMHGWLSQQDLPLADIRAFLMTELAARTPANESDLGECGGAPRVPVVAPTGAEGT